MARKIKAKEILRLRDAGLSRTSIAKSQHMSKTSVCDVFDAADLLGMSWESVRDTPEDDVYRALFPERNIVQDPFEEPDWEHVHSEMAKVGVTLKLLHAEYADAARRGMWRRCPMTASASATADGRRCRG